MTKTKQRINKYWKSEAALLVADIAALRKQESHLSRLSRKVSTEVWEAYLTATTPVREKHDLVEAKLHTSYKEVVRKSAANRDLELAYLQDKFFNNSSKTVSSE